MICGQYSPAATIYAKAPSRGALIYAKAPSRAAPIYAKPAAGFPSGGG